MSKILEQRLKQAEFGRNLWRFEPEEATTFEDVLKPSYWVHVARTLQTGDHIEVVARDQSYFAELFVRSVADGEVRVAVLRKVELDDVAASPAPSEGEYEIKHRGGAGWSVLRKTDRKVMVERLDTKSAAEDWLASHTNALA